MLMKKLLSKKGESIAEVLIAMLVFSLAMVILAGGIVMSARISRTVADKMKSAKSQVGADPGSLTPATGVVNEMPTSPNVILRYTDKNNNEEEIEFVSVRLFEADGYYYYEIN